MFGVTTLMKNEPLMLVVSLAVDSTHPLRETRTSKALSSGASSESMNHIAPWKWSVSPAATQALLGTSSRTRAPSLSRTFIHPRPKVRLTRRLSSLIRSSGEKPAEPLSSRHPVLNRTLFWSGKSLVIRNIQWISRMLLLRIE
ncbi:MAG: Uncharacterised protein [Candidatus Poseidoniaceae archaeon]|nr:MAG: Uncharacterised protein [Candidatus Poseidoniaceae archaeon]